MLQHSLVMRQVFIPGLPPSWPASLNLALGLLEVLLLEGADPAGGEALLRVAATLEAPRQGEVIFWGQNALHLHRLALCRLRRQLAYVGPDQVLLHRLTLGENIALAQCYEQGTTVAQTLAEHQLLLAQLHLGPYLSLTPPDLPPVIVWRGLWARELAQAPELILAHLEGPAWHQDNPFLLFRALEDYCAREQGAILLVGHNLEMFYPLAHRVLRVENRQLVSTRRQVYREPTPVDFFPLV